MFQEVQRARVLGWWLVAASPVLSPDHCISAQERSR